MTLTELCNHAEINPAIFKKYQHLFPIIGKGLISLSGRKSYSKIQADAALIIHDFRRISISYSDIKIILNNPHESTSISIVTTAAIEHKKVIKRILNLDNNKKNKKYKGTV